MFTVYIMYNQNQHGFITYSILGCHHQHLGTDADRTNFIYSKECETIYSLEIFLVHRRRKRSDYFWIYMNKIIAS